MTQQRTTTRPTLETLEGRDAPATVAAVFPGIPGLWMQRGTGWAQITANTPSQVAVSEKGEVLADFDAQGLWYVARGACGWVQVTANNPDLIAIADNGNPSTGMNSDLFASFDGQGLWRAFANPQRGRGTWQSLTQTQPSQIVAATTMWPAQANPPAGTASLAADFDAQGLWTWSLAQGWYKISAADPTDIALNHFAFFGSVEWPYDRWTLTYVVGYRLAADFGANGLWWMGAYNRAFTPTPDFLLQPQFGSGRWQQVTTEDPYEVAVDEWWNSYAAFSGNAPGLYEIKYSPINMSSRSLVTSYPIGSMAMGSDGLYATFPGNVHGWQRYSGGAWSIVSDMVPVLYAVA
jgi:hypothetical protein